MNDCVTPDALGAGACARLFVKGLEMYAGMSVPTTCPADRPFSLAQLAFGVQIQTNFAAAQREQSVSRPHDSVEHGAILAIEDRGRLGEIYRLCSRENCLQF